jgi:hypothetical protein
MTSDEQILQAVESVDGFMKYFPFIIWLPRVVKQEYIIRVIYGLECIFWWENCLLSAAIFPLCIALFLITGSQFKLISSLIRDMDEVMCKVENPDNELHEFPGEIFTGNKKEISTERKLSSKMRQNYLQEDDIYQHSERFHDISSPEIKSTTKNDPGSVYLLECIKLHQASIE